MKKFLLSFIIILSIFLLFSCQSKDDNSSAIDLDNANSKEPEIIIPQNEAKAEEKTEEENDNDAQASKEKDALMVAKDENQNLNSDSEKNENQNKSEFVLKAIVKKVGEHIEVEVIESNYAFGTYWILTPSTTVYYNANGSVINRQNIKVGDTVEISYSGQTMLSYPPQVVAYSIKLITD